MMPWGYTRRVPDDYQELMTVAKEAARRVMQTHNTYWKVGPPSHILYEASGGSFDWVKASAGIKYAYTWNAVRLLLVRDSCFRLPASFLPVRKPGPASVITPNSSSRSTVRAAVVEAALEEALAVVVEPGVAPEEDLVAAPA